MIQSSPAPIFRFPILRSLLVLLFHTNLCSIEQIQLTHKKWKLEGAEERIEQIRTGKAEIEILFPDGIQIPENASIQYKMLEHEFDFGISMTQFWTFNKGIDKEKSYLENIKKLFNYVTMGTYWAWHEKTKGKWEFQNRQADVLSFAQKNNMTVKGHPLMWHNTFPRWADKITDDQELSNTVDFHIVRTLKNFPEITEWDSYNEAPGILFKHVDKNAGGRRYLMQNGGLYEGMTHVHNVIESTGTQAKMVLNHYKINEPSFHKLIEHLQKKGKKIDKIGIQTHMFTESQNYDEEFYWDQFEQYKKHGLPVQLSEITILSAAHFKDWREKQKWKQIRTEALKNKEKPPQLPNTLEGIHYQAGYLHDFYTLAFSHPIINGMVYWCGTDRRCWDGQQGGLLDENMNPKDSYLILYDLIKRKWWTDGEAKLKKQRLHFRGFYGTYQISTTIHGTHYSANYKLQKNKESAKSLKLTAL